MFLIMNNFFLGNTIGKTRRRVINFRWTNRPKLRCGTGEKRRVCEVQCQNSGNADRIHHTD